PAGPAAASSRSTTTATRIRRTPPTAEAAQAEPASQPFPDSPDRPCSVPVGNPTTTGSAGPQHPPASGAPAVGKSTEPVLQVGASHEDPVSDEHTPVSDSTSSTRSAASWSPAIAATTERTCS